MCFRVGPWQTVYGKEMPGYLVQVVWRTQRGHQLWWAPAKPGPPLRASTNQGHRRKRRAYQKPWLSPARYRDSAVEDLNPGMGYLWAHAGGPYHFSGAIA